MKSPILSLSSVSVLLVWYIGALIGYASQNYPQRIISLGPAITEELYILGAEANLVGCTVYCQRPPKAREKEKVGTVMEVNLEKIVALEPDLVLATSLTKAEAGEKLKSLGIKVITFSTPKSFEEICQNFLALGRIVGKEKEAEEIVNIAKKRVDFVKKRVKGLQKPEVFIQVGARPLVAVTRDSFVNDFIKFAGGINSIQSPERTQIRYSRERVLEDNPDVIIIVTMGINGEEETKTWQKFKTLNAVKNNEIYIIDPDRITSPTPLIFAETLEKIAKILHPEIER